MLRFGEPSAALLLVLLPFLVGLTWWSGRDRRRRLHAWTSEQLSPLLTRGLAPWRRTARHGLLLAAVLGITLALLRPQWGFHYEEITRRGIDLVIVVDVSESMLAQDVSPSRLERAKREISDFLHLVQGDRIALVASAGTSFIQCPLTLDYGALREFLTLVDTDLIPTPGTDLGAALRTAADALEPSGPSRGKAIVLISDGGNLQGDPVAVARTLHQDRGITIYSIGVGRPDEAVPIPDRTGGLKEYEGKVVTTKLEENTLKQIALAANGVYVRAVTGDLDLEEIYTDIRDRHQSAELGKTRRKVYHERFVWPLALAIACLVLEAGIGDRRRVALAVLAAVMLAPRPAAADTTSDVARGIRKYEQDAFDEALEAFAKAHEQAPDDFRTQFDLGTALYESGEHERALEMFQRAGSNADDPEFRAKSLYNAGNALVKLGRLDEAVDAYERSLAADPADDDAKANLELVRKLIQEHERQQQARQQQDQDAEQQRPDQGEQRPGDPQPRDDGSQSDQSEQSQQGAAGSEREDAQQPSSGNEQQEQSSPRRRDESERHGEASSGDGSGSPSPESPEAERAPGPSAHGGMTQAEAQQWLRQLPSEDAEALKDFWRRQQPAGEAQSPRKDW